MLKDFRRAHHPLAGGPVRWLIAIAAAVLLAAPGCDQSHLPKSPAIRVAASPKSDSSSQDAPRLSQAFQLRAGNARPLIKSKAVVGPVFIDRAAEAGVEHVYVTGPADLLLMVQPTGGGCGWLDFDSDGLWDLYLNQAGDPSAPPSPDR